MGVNSFVENWTCGGVTWAYRTDTRAVIRWILRTVPQSQVDDLRIASV